MPNPRILITDGLDKTGLDELVHDADVDIREGISPEELNQIISEYDGLIVRSRTKVTEQVLNQANKLKVVGRAGVGVDNIDLNAAKKHGIVVVNTPTSTSIAVAELCMGMILGLARSLPRADSSMKGGEWLKKQFQGIELYGKTLGVIGMGNIGAAVAERAKAFGMSIFGFDLFLEESVILRRGATPCSLKEIFTNADVITIHVPLTDQTSNLIDAGAIEQMKPGVYIICTARGGIIDEQALLDGLIFGKVGGAALDVYDNEPPGEISLVKHANVIATPHIGAQTIEAQRRASRDIALEVLTVLRGENPRWRVG